MLKMFKSKQFYVITTIVLLIGFFVMMFINNQKNDVLAKASQLLVDNNVDITSLYSDKEDAEQFTKSQTATTQPTKTAVTSKGVASESNLRTVVDAFALGRYGYDKSSTIESIQNSVKNVTTSSCYDKHFKDVLQKEMINIDKTLETNEKVTNAYFSGLDTLSPQAYVVIDISYTVDKIPYAITVKGTMNFTYDKANDTWLIDDLNLTEK